MKSKHTYVQQHWDTRWIYQDIKYKSPVRLWLSTSCQLVLLPESMKYIISPIGKSSLNANCLELAGAGILPSWVTITE